MNQAQHANLCEKINQGWYFLAGDFTQLSEAELTRAEAVQLPHNAVDLPYNYFDETCYQKAFTYQKKLDWQAAFDHKQVWLQFDGTMANAHVYLNGQLIGAHADGYTPFEINLTAHLIKQQPNYLTVVIDGSENPSIPPFGGQIDYLTYAGIYRHVWLKTRDVIRIKNVRSHVENLFKFDALCKTYEETPPDLVIKTFLEIAEGHHPGQVTLNASLVDNQGTLIASYEHQVAIAGGQSTEEIDFKFEQLANIALWSLEQPALYQLNVSIKGNLIADEFQTKIGFRQAEFKADGFYLNGQKIKIRGINRHQAYPYVGYAMGDHAQRADADLIKKEWKFNLVRTSHYPQAKSFLERCDEIGLLVFEEIPGWQHIGDETWQAISIDSVKRMVERDWNHPSVILWGVRINESPDNDAFFTETNRVARALDPSRQTGGVRCIANSHLLEDVYTMNDFILNGGELALRDQQVVTGLKHKVPYMVTEFNGHMFPTKRFDPELHQVEHVTRHLRVMNAYYADESIAGGIGWCLFDYNTHKDFGAGDRICYHGITDMFRIPKFAAYAYKSQCEPSDEVVLQPVTVWARGERPECLVLPTMILTNCERVEFQVGEHTVKSVYPAKNRYPHLPHPPMIVDDLVISAEEFGLWGMKWSGVTLRGYIGETCVKTVEMPENPVATRLRVKSDYAVLPVKQKAQTRMTIEALDQCDNPLWFIDEFVTVTIEGDAKVIGPTQLILKGGAVGFWLEAGDNTGTVIVEVSSHRFEPVRLSIELIKE